MNGGIYHRLCPPELETIIQVFFPDLWSLYIEGLRFPHIQRVDIGRICILSLCGGMYVDLDIMPNRDVYYQVPFAVCRINRTEWKEAKRKTRRSGIVAKTIKTTTKSRLKATPYKNKHRYDPWYEMEAMIATARNPVLARWLMFVVENVKRQKHAKGFYKTAKGRYVLHTTGPCALNMFLKHKCERDTRRSLRFIACYVQKLQDTMKTQERAAFDVVSYDSCSWAKAEKLWIAPRRDTPIPLGTLPLMRLTRRVSVKRHQSDVYASNRPIIDEHRASKEESSDDEDESNAIRT